MKHCVDSGTWTTTEEQVDKAWSDCKEKTGYTSYHGCLQMNNVNHEHMLPQFDCFDETIDPEKHADNNVYRWAVVDLSHYKSTPAKLYKKYSECLEKHPVTTNNNIEFSNCYSDKIEKEEQAELMTRNWEAPTNDEVKKFWKDCESTVTPEDVEKIHKGNFDEHSLPFLRCVIEKSKTRENGCFHLERDIKINHNMSGKDHREEMKECFKGAIGKEKLDGVKYFTCMWKLMVVS